MKVEGVIAVKTTTRDHILFVEVCVWHDTVLLRQILYGFHKILCVWWPWLYMVITSEKIDYKNREINDSNSSLTALQICTKLHIYLRWHNNLLDDSSE